MRRAVFQQKLCGFYFWERERNRERETRVNERLVAYKGCAREREKWVEGLFKQFDGILMKAEKKTLGNFCHQPKIKRYTFPKILLCRPSLPTTYSPHFYFSISILFFISIFISSFFFSPFCFGHIHFSFHFLKSRDILYPSLPLPTWVSSFSSPNLLLNSERNPPPPPGPRFPFG